MDTAIAAAIAAVLLAIAGWLRTETELRRQRHRLDDTQARVGADRRAGDPARGHGQERSPDERGAGMT